ncbi:MAG: hypothetical protein LQ339_003617 [Xanthoria mediterranea]|nr:MAG: hypothetical protein LQ339_003617 [Xanthoria mediterranea]
MSSGAVVQDPFLQSVLTASVHAREQCMQLIELAEHSAVTPSKTLPDDTKFQLSALQKQLNADLARLRQASRDSIFEVRATKQDTAEARQEVDRLHLQLQNFYYEERHLRGEISACESYDHQYQQLPLIPVEEFLQVEPEHADSDEKSLMFARISHELAEREILEQQRQELLRRKQLLVAENKKRKDDLASLDKDLETFIDAAKPIQTLFEKQY